MEGRWGIAAVWLGLALIASLISIRFKMSVALVEILVGVAADEIIRVAEKEEINLIVLGRQGHSRIARFILGSTTDRVSEHCHCTVTIVT